MIKSVSLTLLLGLSTYLSSSAQDVLWSIEGPSDGSRFGSSLANGGDLNGDQIQDVIVGAPDYNDAGGRETGYVSAHSGVDGSLLWDFVGENPLDRFGESVAIVADVDGDAVQDVVVGAPEYGRFMGLFLGRAYLLSGATGLLLHVWNATGPGAEGDSLGTAVSSVGDLDGGGKSDIAISSPRFDGLAGSWSGRVSVYSSETLLEIRTFEGITPFEWFGGAVASAGDLDGDLVPDIIIGAERYAGIQGRLSGRFDIYSGATSALILRVDGPETLALFGSAVTGLGDIDGDDVPDVLVGAPERNDGLLTNAGYAAVHSGATGLEIWSNNGGHFDAAYGYALSDPGDYDGDGQSDFAVAAYGEGLDPKAGWGAGCVTIYSGLSKSPIHTVFGDTPFNELGRSIASLDDSDGDGLPEIAAGSPGFGFAPEADRGQVTVYKSRGCSANFEAFGVGLAGSGGFVPSLSAEGSSCDPIGYSINLDFGLGGAGSLLFVGLVEDKLDPFFGGRFYVDLESWFVAIGFVLEGASGVPGEGTIRLQGAGFYSEPSLQVLMQMLIIDAGGPEGISLSNALRLTIAE